MARLPAQHNQHMEQQQPQQHQTQVPEHKQTPRHGIKIEWILVPLVLLGMWHLLSKTACTFSWDQIMTVLGVHNRQRYTMLAQLCLVLILIVGAYKIFMKK